MSTFQTIYEIENLKAITAEDLQKADIRVISREGEDLKVLFGNKSYQAKIKKFDIASKDAIINVNGFDFKIKIVEPLDQLVKDLGFLSSGKHSVKEIKSPMPGLVVNIFVAPGQQVSEGEKLLTLEAMKMENILKSPGEGIIKKIHVTQGSSVDKNQLLVVFE